jgi:hypothetical protein
MLDGAKVYIGAHEKTFSAIDVALALAGGIQWVAISPSTAHDLVGPFA